MVTVDSLDVTANLVERLKQALLLQQRNTRYDELTQASITLTPAQQTALTTFISSQLANLKTNVAALS